jgi:predicted PurR-regulated permease PerM
MTIAVLWLVQQIDGTLISPRIMSSQTGISPAAVLLSVFVGSGLGGIVGMLFAMPIIMSLRTVFRVFVQRYKNV